MRAPGSLDLVTVDFFRPGPSLRAPEHEHRPARARRLLRALDALDLEHAALHGFGHLLMHLLRIFPRDAVRRPTGAAKETLELRVSDACEQRGVVDLVAVEMQNGEHRAVARRAQEFVRVPRGRERA